MSVAWDVGVDRILSMYAIAFASKLSQLFCPLSIQDDSADG